MNCQICSNATVQFLDLGSHPPCDFLTEAELHEEARFPLTVHSCTDCALVQLGTIVDQETLFKPKAGYHHIAALSASFMEHLGLLASDVLRRFDIAPDGLVVEIGSNDGALLEAFRRHGVKVLGVDPTDVSDLAIDKGLDTIKEFFGYPVATQIRRDRGPARIIAALNTFAHVEDLDDVVKGIRDLLADGGVFVSENHYVLDLIRGLQYDFIYHEHSRYYSVHSLVRLLDRYDMVVFDVERIPTHSGSIRVFACKRGDHPISAAVRTLLRQEEAGGLHDGPIYESFALRVETHKLELPRFLRDIRRAGHTIAGLTFPARAVTLLNTCGIGPELLEYITELSPIKIGKYSPGTHIKVVGQEILFGPNAPDYGLLLSWHIRNEIIPAFRSRGFRGKFIIPLPTPTLVD